MDPGTAVFASAIVTSLGGVVMSLIGVFGSADRARLVRERDDAVAQLKALAETEQPGTDS